MKYTPHNSSLQQAFRALIRELSDEKTWEDKNAPINLTTFQSYKHLKFEIENDSVIASHFNINIQFGTGGFRFTGADELIAHVFGAIERPLGIEKKNAFESIFRDFENIFYSDEMTYAAIGPVQGLSVFRENLERRSETSKSYDDETNPLVISDDLQLSPLDNREYSLSHQLEIVRRYHFRMSDSLYAIKAYFIASKILTNDDGSGQLSADSQQAFNHEFETASERIEDILVALRLFKPGKIFLGGIMVVAQNQLIGNTTFIPRTLSNPYFSINPYILDLEKEGSGVLSLYRHYIDAKNRNRKHLVVASRWLNYGSVSDKLEDKVISLMVAAEAAAQVGRQKEKSEKIADFFGSCFPSEKNEVSGHLLKLYKLRNQVIHNGDMSRWLATNSMKPEEVLGFVEKGADLIRQALVQKLNISYKRG